MKAAAMPERPAYSLMKQSDIQNFYHLQMPRWLFTDPSYNGLTLEAKVVYTFLLNRFQLSRLNGWMNDQGEVFIIYTRASLAEEIQISYHKVIDAMKELSCKRLIWERRCGRGAANQIYLARVVPEGTQGGSAPFVEKNHEAAGARPSETVFHEDGMELPSPAADVSPPQTTTVQEMPDGNIKKCSGGISGSAETAGPEVRDRHTSNIYTSSTDCRDINVSPSVGVPARVESGRAEETELADILEGCELWAFPPELAGVFGNAIERLYYSEEFRIGKALLPRSKVRSHLHDLDNVKLQAAAAKIRRNTGREVKNSTAYLMAVIFNCIWESESDLLVDPYLNSLSQPPGGTGRDGL